MGVRGLASKGVPATLPKWLLFLKIAVLVIALIVLALAAYAISVFSSEYGGYYGYYGSGAPGLLIFVAIKTFIVFGGAVALELWAPQFFFRIIVLIAYVLSIIFWLSAWAWAASYASALLAASSYYSGSVRYYDDYYKRAGGAMAGAAALGAFAWILSIVNLFFFIRACMADPDGNAAPAVYNANQQAELGQVPAKQEGQPPAVGQQYYAAPAPGQQYAAPAAYQDPNMQQQQPYYGQPQQPAYPQPAVHQ